MTGTQDFCKVCFHDRVSHINAEGACTVDLCDCEVYRHGETRVTSSTGASKGTKDARYDLIPIPALDALARLYGFGAKKYAEHNWRLGYDWSKSYAAAQRHMNAFWRGENIDPETQTPHVICAAFHMFALATYLEEHPEFDDRFETREPEGPSVQEVIEQAFSHMATTFGMPVSRPEMDVKSLSPEDLIEISARHIADRPDGTTISFGNDVSDEDIAKVFVRVEEIKKSRSNDG